MHKAKISFLGIGDTRRLNTRINCICASKINNSTIPSS